MQDTLTAARRELDALIITRDWYIVDIHAAPLPVALWRTLAHRRPLTRLNNAIEAQRDVVDYLETAPVPYRIHPAALPCIDDALFDLVDALGNSSVNVTGEIDGRTVETDDGVLVVCRDGVEEYRVVCGDEPFTVGNITDLAVNLEGRLLINGRVLNCTGGRATIDQPLATLSSQARAALDLLCACDLLLSGEIDGAVVISEQLETAVRVTARIKGAVVYERYGEHALELDTQALCEIVNTLPAQLHGHSLTNRYSDVRVISDNSGALITVNNWCAARMPPAAH